MSTITKKLLADEYAVVEPEYDTNDFAYWFLNDEHVMDTDTKVALLNYCFDLHELYKHMVNKEIIVD